MDVSDLIKTHEGLRLASYDDATGDPVPVGGHARGTLTIGYGHTGADVFAGQTCTTAQADAWLAADIAIATERAAADIGDEWSSLNDARQAALIDMAFELGGAGLADFRDMVVGVQCADWPEAHYQALKSKWAREVPKRAQTDAGMLLSGEWPVV